MNTNLLIKLEDALKSIQKAYFELEQIRDAEETFFRTAVS